MLVFMLSEIHCAFCFYFVFSLCREILRYDKNEEMSLQLQHTNNSNSLKVDVHVLPELVRILEQGLWRHIYSPSEDIGVCCSRIYLIRAALSNSTALYTLYYCFHTVATNLHPALSW